MELYDTEPLLADVTGLPLYVVNEVVRRDLGDGIASIINCRRQDNGLIIPQCEIIIAARHLITIGRGASDFALEMYRRQMAQLTELVGARH